MTDNNKDSPIAAAVIKLADSVDRLATQVQMNTNALHPPHSCCNQQSELDEQPRDDDDADADQPTPQTEDDDNISDGDDDDDDDEEDDKDQSSDDNSSGDKSEGEDEADAEDNSDADEDKNGSQEEDEQQDSERPDSFRAFGDTPTDMISTRSARDRSPPTSWKEEKKATAARAPNAEIKDDNNKEDDKMLSPFDDDDQDLRTARTVPSEVNLVTARSRSPEAQTQTMARSRSPVAQTQTMAVKSDSNSNFPTAWTRPRGSPCQCLPNACTCGLFL